MKKKTLLHYLPPYINEKEKGRDGKKKREKEKPGGGNNFFHSFPLLTEGKN